MTGLEPVLVKAGQSVVVPAVKRWLADRRHRDEVNLPLPSFLPRAVAHVLPGITGLAEQLAQVLDRLPVRSLLAAAYLDLRGPPVTWICLRSQHIAA